MPTKKIKVDWASWIASSIVLGGTFISVGGFLFNQRILPKEKEYEERFERDEKKTKERFEEIEDSLEKLKEDIDEEDEKREVENKKQTALLHSIDLQLVKFTVGFDAIKEDIKELKERAK